MGKSVLYVGLDVHKMSVDVAIAEAGAGAEVRFYGRIGGGHQALQALGRQVPVNLVAARTGLVGKALMRRFATRRPNRQAVCSRTPLV